MDQAIPAGLCQCGCGQPTRPAPQTLRSKGWVKGQPLRFIKNHVPTKDNAGYLALHEWVNKRNPKAGTCEQCGRVGYTEYALIHGRTYSRNREDYRELCSACHRRYDFPNPRSPRARLTEDNVREIRRRWAAGEKQVALGREFGVTYHAIWRIVHRRNWAWVQGEEVRDA